MKNYFKAKNLLVLATLALVIMGGFYFTFTKVEAACSATDQYPDPASPYPAGFPIPNGFCRTNCYTGETICHCNAGYHNTGTNDEPVCSINTGLSGSISPDTSNCTIARLASSCNQTLSWTTTGAPAGVSSTVTNPGSATPASVTGNNGSQSFSIPYTVAGGFIQFTLKNGTTTLDQAIVSARCGAGDAWDGTKCAISSLPDLTASAPTPSIAAPGIARTFSSTVSNIGSSSTGAPFSYFFQKATAPNGGGTITDLASGSMSTLAASGTATATSPAITFALGDTPSIRVCADKTSRNSTTPATGAVITESNENNNCSGAWTNVNVTNNMFGALSASDCTITAGNSTCNSTLNWSTTNPVATSAVTSAVDNTGANSPNFHVSNPDANSGTNVLAPIVPALSRTFYLYNNAVLLATATATASCASGSAWNGDSCITSPISVSIFADPAGPLIAPASTTLTWSITGAPDGCTASNAWTGAKAQGNGIHTEGKTGLAVGSYTYTITCTKDRPAAGDTLTVTSSATVVVSTVGTGVDGQCGLTNKTCIKGTYAGDYTSFPSRVTWTCNGVNGGGPSPLCVEQKGPGFIEN